MSERVRLINKRRKPSQLSPDVLKRIVDEYVKDGRSVHYLADKHRIDQNGLGAYIRSLGVSRQRA